MNQVEKDIYSVWHSGPQAMAREIKQIKRETHFTAHFGPDYIRCNACGKLRKNDRWLGTLHICSK